MDKQKSSILKYERFDDKRTKMLTLFCLNFYHVRVKVHPSFDREVKVGHRLSVILNVVKKYIKIIFKTSFADIYFPLICYDNT